MPTVSVTPVSPVVSKTIIVNLLSLVFVVLQGFGVIDVVPDSVEPFVPAAMAVANIVLRFFTKAPLTVAT